jgi:hypothetical protein
VPGRMRVPLIVAARAGDCADRVLGAT